VSVNPLRLYPQSGYLLLSFLYISNFLFKYISDKTYSTTSEEELRWKIFLNNKLEVLEYASQLEVKGVKSAKNDIQMNQFSDLLTSEFNQMMLGANTVEPTMERIKDEGATFIPPANVELPSYIDWRQLGAVTPVKNQGYCGSCWAFSATGALEGQHFRQTGKLVSLSEQELVDCSYSMGCQGGWPYKAFELIKQKGGIDTEQSYPYEGTGGHYCRHNQQNVGATDKGTMWITSGNEEALKSAVATRGPVSVLIYARKWSRLLVGQKFLGYLLG